jgi:RimJ/RimL family protein N-acetyltransferase
MAQLDRASHLRLPTVGTVQATLTRNGEAWTALVAWVIGSAWQKQGFASEAAQALVDWLHHHGVADVIAHIHRDHRASAIVATRAGLMPTADEVEGEQVWRTA